MVIENGNEVFFYLKKWKKIWTDSILFKNLACMNNLE